MRWVSLGEPLPGEAPLLEEVRRAFAEERLPGPAWKEVRSRLERKVWRVPSRGEGPALFVKLQLFRSFRVRFRYALRRAPTEKEARKALRILARGVAAPRPLLLGREGIWWGKRRSVLVSREAPGLPAARALEEGRLSLEELAEFLARLASRGIHHPDLHLGNLLAGPEGLVLLDLQSCRLLPFRAGRRRVEAMAAKLGASLVFLGLAGDREWARALAEAGLLSGPEGEARLRRLRESARARERARRLKRCLMDSSGFARERWGRGRLFRRRAAGREEVLREARAALGGRARGWIPRADGAPCFVASAGRARALWLEFRRLELEGFPPGLLPLALVEESRLRGLGCLVFPEGTSPGELALAQERLSLGEKRGRREEGGRESHGVEGG